MTCGCGSSAFRPDGTGLRCARCGCLQPTAPGEARMRPIPGPEVYLDGVDKLFSYPTAGMQPAEADAVRMLEENFEGCARIVLVFLKPCSDRNRVLHNLRESYLLACDSLRLGGAF